MHMCLHTGACARLHIVPVQIRLHDITGRTQCIHTRRATTKTTLPTNTNAIFSTAWRVTLCCFIFLSPLTPLLLLLRPLTPSILPSFPRDRSWISLSSRSSASTFFASARFLNRDPSFFPPLCSLLPSLLPPFLHFFARTSGRFLPPPTGTLCVFAPRFVPLSWRLLGESNSTRFALSCSSAS